jgi:hypothetical protein
MTVTAHHPEDQTCATADLVLLCCFGANQDASTRRSATQVRQALVDAGFRPGQARHLVRDSALLRATADGRYGLRQVDEVATAGPARPAPNTVRPRRRWL